nr:DNA-binding response regulator [Bradyrhizobium symbiodeficiens]QDF37195.1 response regulator transcription factor [Bradyrhizobium symbiodeficiens]
MRSPQDDHDIGNMHLRCIGAARDASRPQHELEFNGSARAASLSRIRASGRLQAASGRRGRRVRTPNMTPCAAEPTLPHRVPKRRAERGTRIMNRILLIEDDTETAEAIVAELTDRGFEVQWAGDGVDGLDRARRSSPDAMIVDRMLPKMDGLTVIEALRKDQFRTPVLVLSALGAVDDRVRGLRMGGDDYLTKPFAIIELVARIEALLRRPTDDRKTILHSGPLELDLIERTARRGDRELDLLPREFRLLEYMMRRNDQLLTRAMLLEEVWNYKFVPATTNLIDVHMGRLRHKVDGPGEVQLIHNVRGSGFVLRSRQ